MDKGREARLWELTKTNPQAVVAELQAEVAPPDADPTALYLQRVAYYRLGEWVPARKRLGRAVTSKPDHAHAWYYLALVAKQQGDTPGAVSALRTAAAQSPSPKLLPLIHKELAQLDPTFRPPSEAPPAPARETSGARGIYTNVPAQWAVLPPWLQVLAVAFTLAVLVFIGSVVWDIYGPGGARDQHEQMEQEVEQRQEESCEDAAEHGVELPGC